jgi:hypothetical protein
MRKPTPALLTELQEQVTYCLQRAQTYQKLPPEVLQWRPAEGKWSVLECLEHLNRYGEIYLEEFRTKIAQAPKQPVAEFKSGWLGNYAANTMRPNADGSVLKMPALKDKNPLHAQLDIEVITEFIRQQNELLKVLNKAAGVNLSKVKCKLTLPLLKFNLGDTLRFIINHQIRHLQQADRVLAAQGSGLSHHKIKL